MTPEQLAKLKEKLGPDVAVLECRETQSPKDLHYHDWRYVGGGQQCAICDAYWPHVKDCIEVDPVTNEVLDDGNVQNP